MLEQKHANIWDTFTKIKEVHRLLMDEKRHLNPGSHLLQVHLTDATLEMLINKVKMMKNKIVSSTCQLN